MVLSLFIICKLPWPEDSKVIFGLRDNIPPTCLPIHLLSCLVQRHNKRTCRLVLHTISLTLNVKQGSCKYKFLKLFRLRRRRIEPPVLCAGVSALSAGIGMTINLPGNPISVTQHYFNREL